MADVTALQALTDAIERGEFPADVSARDLGLETYGDGLPIIKTMYSAFSGSLDGIPPLALVLSGLGALAAITLGVWVVA